MDRYGNAQKNTIDTGLASFVAKMLSPDDATQLSVSLEEQLFHKKVQK